MTEPNYYLEFVVSGTVNLVGTWARRGFRESPEDMAKLAGKLILRGVQSLRDERGGARRICGETEKTKEIQYVV